MPSSFALLPHRSDAVLTVTMNRPEARNALSESLMRALQLTLDEAVQAPRFLGLLGGDLLGPRLEA